MGLMRQRICCGAGFLAILAGAIVIIAMCVASRDIVREIINETLARKRGFFLGSMGVGPSLEASLLFFAVGLVLIFSGSSCCAAARDKSARDKQEVRLHAERKRR